MKTKIQTWSFRLQTAIVSFEYTAIFMSFTDVDSLNFKKISEPFSTGSEYSAGESRPKSSNIIFMGYDKQYIGILYWVPSSS